MATNRPFKRAVSRLCHVAMVIRQRISQGSPLKGSLYLLGYALSKLIIPVRKNILTPQHRKAIGIAIWEFMWMIDRITKEINGVGIVLGGKPVASDEIADCLGLHRNSVDRNLVSLVSNRYLVRQRTSSGYSYSVPKSSKFGEFASQEVVNQIHKKREIRSTGPRGNDSQEVVTGFTGSCEPDSQETPDLRSRDNSETTGEYSKRSKRPPDDAYEQFIATYLTETKVPYQKRKGDFEQLKTLRDLLGLPNLRAPEGWNRALKNYFNTPQSSYTLADICVKYSTFIRWALDRFGKPVSPRWGETKNNGDNPATNRLHQPDGYFKDHPDDLQNVPWGKEPTK